MINLYNVVFSGELFPGYQKKEVVLALVKVTHLTEAEVKKRLFSGDSVVLKRCEDIVTANEYVLMLAEIGASASIRAEPVENNNFHSSKLDILVNKNDVLGVRDSGQSVKPKKSKFNLKLVMLSLLLTGLISGFTFMLYQVLFKFEMPHQIIQLEDQLISPDLVVMANGYVNKGLHFKHWILDLFGDVDYLNLIKENHAVSDIISHFMESYADIDHAIAGFYIKDDGRQQWALILTGQFDIASMMIELKIIMESKERQYNKKKYWLFRSLDKQKCTNSKPFAVHFLNNKIMISSPGLMQQLLGDHKTVKNNATLDAWRNMRKGKLFSLAVLKPDEVFKLNPKWATGGIGNLKPVYVGISALNYPLGIKVTASLSDKNKKFLTNALNDSDMKLQKRLDHFQLVEKDGVEVLKISNDKMNDALHLMVDVIRSAYIEKTEVTRIKNNFAFVDVKVNQFQPRFQTNYTYQKIPAFDVKLNSDFKPDISEGPFAIQLASTQLNSEQFTEFTFKVRGSQIDNIGNSKNRVSFNITDALGFDGKQKIKDAPCGQYYYQYEPLRAFNNIKTHSVLSGAKTIRIEKEVPINQIQVFKGEFNLQIPTRTSKIVIKKLTDYQIIEKQGVRIRFYAAKANSIRYDVMGEMDRLLQVIPLDINQKPLIATNIKEREWEWFAGKAVYANYTNKINQIELVFAVQDNLRKVPFTLLKNKPGTDGFQISYVPEVKPYDLSRFQDNFGAFSAPVGDGSVKKLAETRVGVFAVILNSLDKIKSTNEVKSVMTLKTPDMPGLNHNYSAATLYLNRWIASGEQREMFAEIDFHLSKSRNKIPPVLSGQKLMTLGKNIDIQKLEALHGDLSVRFPLKIQTLSLQSLTPGLRVKGDDYFIELIEIGRDHFTLKVEGDRYRILQIRPYNELSKLMTTEVHFNKKEDYYLVDVSTKGNLSKINILTAVEQDIATIPIKLKLSVDKSK